MRILDGFKCPWKRLPQSRNCSARETTRYEVAQHVRASAQDDKIIILDTNVGQFYLCDGINAEFWRGISRGDSPDAIAVAISARYAGVWSQTKTDFETFINELLARRLVVNSRPATNSRGRFLLARAFWELVSYDLQIGVLGFRRMYTGVQRRICIARAASAEDLTTRI